MRREKRGKSKTRKLRKSEDQKERMGIKQDKERIKENKKKNK